jgi:hypothetical protein
MLPHHPQMAGVDVPAGHYADPPSLFPQAEIPSMRMRNLLLAAMFLTFGAGTASATTYDVNFFASNFTGAPAPAPAPNPAIFQGEVHVTFDPTQDYTNETSGITVVGALGLAVDSALAFSYDHTADAFTLGGAASGADTVEFDPATNDFWLFIHDFTAGPLSSDMYQAGYSQTSLGNFIYFTPQVEDNPLHNPNGFAQVSVIATTPLPAGLPLLLTALGALGLVSLARRKPASAGMPVPLS